VFNEENQEHAESYYTLENCFLAAHWFNMLPDLVFEQSCFDCVCLISFL